MYFLLRKSIIEAEEEKKNFKIYIDNIVAQWKTSLKYLVFCYMHLLIGIPMWNT